MNIGKKYPILLSLVLMLLLGVGGVVGVLYWLDDYTHHGQALRVPDLYELQVEDAEMLLKREKLRCLVVDSVYKSGVMPGAIIDQVPKAGAKVKQGRILFLTINATQEKQVLFPNVKDLSERQAQALLVGVGLTIGEVEIVESPYKGLVVGATYKGQEIEAGDKLTIKSAVTLLVGRGTGAIEHEMVDTALLNEEEQDRLIYE